MGPTVAENPHSRTMCVASSVAPARSLAEPVDGSASTMISAARPPRRTASDGIGVLRERGHERVPGFVDGHGMFLLGQQRVRRVTAADEETVPGAVEVG